MGPLFCLITIERTAQLLSQITMQIMQAPQQTQPEIVLGLENHYERLLNSLY